MEIKQSQVDFTTWRNNFGLLDKKQYNDAVGYDLDVRLWQDDREKVEHTIATVLGHGWFASDTTKLEYIIKV